MFPSISTDKAKKDFFWTVQILATISIDIERVTLFPNVDVIRELVPRLFSKGGIRLEIKLFTTKVSYICFFKSESEGSLQVPWPRSHQFSLP